MREKPCRIWDTFLRISPISDEAPIAEDSWFQAKGVSPGAPHILRLLQHEVIPLIRDRLSNKKLMQHVNNYKPALDDRISGYFFLVHDSSSGVPAPPGDRDGYIHLRLYFWHARPRSRVQKLLGGSWVMTKPIRDEGTSIAGIDPRHIRGGDVGAIRKILKAQSELALQIVETYTDDVDLLTLIGQVRQNLHYLSNMFQIKVG